ncbi:MAG: MoxR family ATPase [Actinobacteria bacterium]|nr:MoxR family ATPase [Actinomycetota bacterium]
MTPATLGSPDAVRDALAGAGYLADTDTSVAVFLAEKLGRPLLVEGPAGVGKTELAKSLAQALPARLVRLQCYEGLDEAKALYEWNYRKQLLRIQAAGEAAWRELEEDIFTDEYLLPRPLLSAITSEEPVVLLIDEIDRVDFEFEALLLEILSDFQVTIPELGTIEARTHPHVFLTSNATRDLSEALRRRCLYLHLDYPDSERERDIILARAPEVPSQLAEQVAKAVAAVRRLELAKPPSIAETLDWARTLVAMGAETLEEKAIPPTLSALVKTQADREKVERGLKLAEG